MEQRSPLFTKNPVGRPRTGAQSPAESPGKEQRLGKILVNAVKEMTEHVQDLKAVIKVLEVKYKSNDQAAANDATTSATTILLALNSLTINTKDQLIQVVKPIALW